jgi:hypothetical protein
MRSKHFFHRGERCQLEGWFRRYGSADGVGAGVESGALLNHLIPVHSVVKYLLNLLIDGAERTLSIATDFDLNDQRNLDKKNLAKST